MSPKQSLGIVRVQVEGPVTVGDGLLLVLKLGRHGGTVEVQLGVCGPVVGVDGEGLAETRRFSGNKNVTMEVKRCPHSYLYSL